MNSPSPTSAHGWISIPVSVRAAAAIVRGATGTPASLSACATRWASSACTPGQVARISSPVTPRAAGSRSWAAAMSRRSSPSTRAAVRIPIMSYERGTVRAVRPAGRGDAQERVVVEVDLEERVEQRAVEPGEQLQRLERLQRADHARRRAEHAGLRAARRRAGGGGSGNAQR